MTARTSGAVSSRAMLYPYARSARRRPPSAIDRWIRPGWRLLESHGVETAAPPAAVLDALAGLRLRDLPVVRALLALRGMGAGPETSLLQYFSTAPFVLLEEDRGTELVAGVLVPPAEPDGPGSRRRPPRSPEEFERMRSGAPFAAIATFRADPSGVGAFLWTETWVRTRGIAPGALFGAYWLAIGPFSAWIRRIFLRAAKARAERITPRPATA